MTTTTSTATPELVSALVQAIEAAGFSVSGPTYLPEAEHGEPAWVCNARLALAKATTRTDAYAAHVTG